MDDAVRREIRKKGLDPIPDVLLLDAGNTVVFLDHDAVADVARRAGIAVDAGTLARSEGAAKRVYERIMAAGGSHDRGWGTYLVTLLHEAGVARDAAEAVIAPLREAHDRMNLWRRVPAGLPEALLRLRARGVRVGIVSNSEGKLAQLFRQVGLDDHFETVVDSALEGVSKPDPRIFHIACDRLAVPPSRCFYVGDIPKIDVAGAHAAGMRAALIDPVGFYPDFEDAPIIDSVRSLIDRWLDPAKP